MKNDFPELDEYFLGLLAVNMDDDIREDLHIQMAGCHPGEFLTAYLERDPLYFYREYLVKGKPLGLWL